MPILSSEKHAQLAQWLKRFSGEFSQTEQGRRHSASYETSRDAGRRNFEAVERKAAANEDITDLVLDTLLPHAATPTNLNRGAWIHVAPTITGNIRDWFEGAGWAKREDWPAIARMIFEFLRACQNQPDRFQELCTDIARNPLSKGIKAAFFSPILNALDPDRFRIVNKKPLALIEWVSAAGFRSGMAEYPAVNGSLRELATELTQELNKAAPGLPPADALDMFAHWLVVTKLMTSSEGAETPAPPPSKIGRPRRIWTMSPGEQGRLWNDFLTSNLAAIGWDHLGDLSGYASKPQIEARLQTGSSSARRRSNDALACWQFSNEMQVGDLILAKIGRSQIVGLGIIQSDYRFDPARNEYKHVRSVEWIRQGRWVFNAPFSVKTLTDLTPYRPLVRQVLDELGTPDLAENLFGPVTDGEDTLPGIEPEDDPDTTAPAAAEPYTQAQAHADLFMSEAKLAELRDQLARKKNLVLQGPPGVGKTFVARRLAYLLMGVRDPARVEIVQFHPSMSYEDFVMGLRPDPRTGGFVLKPGVFHRFCQKARQDPLGRPHVFIIDEINRGNLAKIFGELMMLIETDKRGDDHAVTLAYESEAAPRFSVPPNLHLLGTMNTADRSLALVDYALRRRFAFFTLEPELGERFETHLRARDCPPEFARRLSEKLRALNEEIATDTRSLGAGYQIGHSYFCGDDKIGEPAAWLDAIVRFEIRPLLEEYWMDDPKRARAEADKLLAP